MASGSRHERDGVAVGLAHLAAVEAGQRRGRLGDERPRLAQDAGPVAARELLREVDGDLQVLRLVGADRHLVGVEREDVGGHQHRIAVEARVHAVVGVASGRDVGRDRRLVGVRAVEQALGRDVVEQRRPGRRPRGPGSGGTRGRSGGRGRRRAARRRAAASARAAAAGSGRPLSACRSARKTYTSRRRIGRELRQRPDRADVVAEVQVAGRLDAGEGDGWVMAVISLVGGDGAVERSPWPAPLGVRPELRPIWTSGLPASGRPTTTARAERTPGCARVESCEAMIRHHGAWLRALATRSRSRRRHARRRPSRPAGRGSRPPSRSRGGPSSLQPREQLGRVLRPVAQKRGGGHHDVGAGEQVAATSA